MAFNLKWRKVNAPYTVIAVVDIDTEVWGNVRIVGTQFQVRSLQGTWFAIFIIGSDAAPQLAIGPAGAAANNGNYQIVAQNCLQLKNFDTGTFFTLVAVFEPSTHGFDPAVVNDNYEIDTAVTPNLWHILNVTLTQFTTPWIFDDQAGGLQLAWDDPTPVVPTYRADTTILTADLITYTADYESPTV